MRIVTLIVAALLLCAPAHGFNQAARIQGGISGEMKGAASNSRIAELDIYRVLLPDAVLLWNCTGTCADTSTETDLVGNTITAASTSATHKVHKHGGGDYYNFAVDGEIGYFNAGDKDSFSFGDGDNDSPMSFVVWFRATSDIAGPLVFIKGIDMIGGGEYGFGAPSGNIGAYLNDEDTGVMNSIANATHPLSNDGIWHMVAITYDGRGGQYATTLGGNLFLDGDEIANSGSDFEFYVSMVNTAADLTIGGNAGAFGVNPCNISVAVIVGIELTPGQVLDLYNKTKKFYQ